MCGLGFLNFLLVAAVIFRLFCRFALYIALVNLIRAISLFIIMPVYFIANFPPKPCEVYDQVCFEKRDKAPYDLTMSLDSFIFELLYAVVVYVELLNFRMRSDVMRIDMKMKKEAREEIETSAESMQRF
ncbi:hypothetical protein L3Y34_012150 [Caenorhabditis briggsae]|uniref:Uncharacterized protein n=1 Tax=Caenorhabditis briggsae TaxID=6238 RepID=A0AAE9CW94_CAEBR|nr:hypothetical protein L3Y34_012150 [Caenorhabditis briggsae]